MNDAILIITAHGGSIVCALAFSRDGEYIASTSGDNTAKVWTVAGQCCATFKGNL